MSNFKEVYSPGSSFGGWTYRATSNGVDVRIQKKSPSSVTWRTSGSMTINAWTTFANEKGLFNPCMDDPAPISVLSNSFEPDSYPIDWDREES